MKTPDMRAPKLCGVDVSVKRKIMVRDERPHGFFYLAIVTKVGENGITVKYPGWQGTSEAVELLGWQSDRVASHAGGRDTWQYEGEGAWNLINMANLKKCLTEDKNIEDKKIEISKSSKGKRPKEKEKATLPVARTKEKVAVQPKGQPKGQPQGQPKAQKERTPSVGSGDVSLPAVPKTTALSSELVKRRKVEQGW